MALDLIELARQVPLPDNGARMAARNVVSPLGSAVGRLGEVAEWYAAVQGRCPPDPPTTWLVAVADSSEEAFTHVSFLTRVRDTGARGLGHALPLPIVSDLCVPEARTTDAPLGRDDAERAFSTGVAAATDGIREHHGPNLIVVVVVSPDAYVAAAALVCVLTGNDIASVVGRGPGVDDREWMRRCAAARDLARAGRRVLADGDVLDLLAASGSLQIAAAAGLMVRAVISRVPVLLDGPVSAAAALVTHRVSSRVARWLLAAHAAPDPGHAAALKKLRLSPLLDYGISTDDGTGPLLVVPHLNAAARLLVPLAGG
ncbi:MAG: nicotinate-nucleotide--dimethylbenzimidazole phosphoribosyltransferase [Jiangellaceae bacterium]|nr:nicotinate-nucleotide--dimethylbenzimidazole phosphoribosyltransferase [Jiangellaceae bacterium]